MFGEVRNSRGSFAPFSIKYDLYKEKVMNRIACLLVSASLLSSGVVFAQGELDAYRYSQTELNGTARYLGMGGAFGCIGRRYFVHVV